MNGLKTPIKSPGNGDKAKAETAGKGQPPKPRHAPIKHEKPIGQVSDQEFRMYELEVLMYMQEYSTYAQVMIAHYKESEKVIDKQRACLADFQGYVSGPLKERIKLDVHNLTTSFDTPAESNVKTETTVKESSKGLEKLFKPSGNGASTKSETAINKASEKSIYKQRIMLHAYQAHAGNSQEDQEELTDQLEAIKFVESLNPKYYNAASRVSDEGVKKTQEYFFIDDQRVSTINAARKVDSERHGGSNRDTNKTHAQEPKEHKDDEVDREDKADEQGVTRECKISDGVLNYLTNGEKHVNYKCPFQSLEANHKREMLKSLSDGKELTYCYRKTCSVLNRTRGIGDSDSKEKDIAMSTARVGIGWGLHRSI